MTENTELARNPNPEPEGHQSPIPFGVLFLGVGSATPMPGRYQTAQLLTYRNDLFLIDCGEATQYRLIEQRVRSGRLRYIFISHLHGDHYFGLAPLLSSLNLGGRTEDLFLFGPRGLDEVLTTIFRVSNARLNFALHFQAVDPDEPTLLLDLPHLTVTSIPLDHRIACTGFLFREKPAQPKLLRHLLPNEVPVSVLKQLKQGDDVRDDSGHVRFASADYTTPGPPARSYAYCSDTRYLPALTEQVRRVDLLYHEATFMDDNAERATQVYHSTAREAASIAQQAEVGRLVIGHFSSRYKQVDGFLAEAREVFAASDLAVEGQYMAI